MNLLVAGARLARAKGRAEAAMISCTSRLLLAVLFALPACSAERDLDDETGVVSADGGGEPLVEDTDPPGDSGSTSEPTPPPELLLACDLSVACEYPVELVRGDDSNGYAKSDLCALAALAAGGDGLIQTVAVFTSAESFLDHVIVGPGQVLRQAHGRSDGLGLWQNPVERCELRSADFFAACVKSFDPDCLDPEMWVERCEALPGLTCPDA